MPALVQLTSKGTIEVIHRYPVFICKWCRLATIDKKKAMEHIKTEEHKQQKIKNPNATKPTEAEVDELLAQEKSHP
jgi:hypothetical protein